MRVSDRTKYQHSEETNKSLHQKLVSKAWDKKFSSSDLARMFPSQASKGYVAKLVRKSTEYPIYKKDIIVGYADLVLSFEFTNSKNSRDKLIVTAVIEIKSSIEDPSEVIRQIKHYRHHWPKSKSINEKTEYFVYAPSPSNSKQVREMLGAAAIGFLSFREVSK